VLHKLRELRLWPGSLWAALSETPSKYAKEQPGTHTISFVPRGILTDVRTATLPSQAVDTSLPPAELIADSVKRSYITRPYVPSLLCEIAFVPHKGPSVWMSADRLAISLVSGVPAKKGKKEMETAATGRTLVVVDRPTGRSPRSEGTGATNTLFMWVNESLLSVRDAE
jgi:hypothetical protein